MRRDNSEILNSLLLKLLDDNSYMVTDNGELSFSFNLDNEEQMMLNSIIDTSLIFF